MFRLSPFAITAAFVASVAAQSIITSPSAAVWWVAKSENTLSWNCHDPSISSHTTFTVLVTNQNATILDAPLAFISPQANADCSKVVGQNQLSAPAAPGYTILFADPLNETNIFATSDVFEIKPLGVTYPTFTPGLSSSSPSPTSGGANSASSSSAPSKGNGAASSHSVKGAGIVVIVAAAIGTFTL